MAAYLQVYDSVTFKLTAKNWDRLCNTTLSNRVWTTFTFFLCASSGKCCYAIDELDVNPFAMITVIRECISNICSVICKIGNNAVFPLSAVLPIS